MSVLLVIAPLILVLITARCNFVSGLVAMMAKVMLVLTMELAFLPVAYGFWLDICALPLFEGSLQQRLALLRSAPVSWTLLHWMTGMACLMVTAAFLSVVRSVLRPGGQLPQDPAASCCCIIT